MQTGLVRFGYRHLVVLGPGSQQAAVASECAGEQGAFWAYHDRLYAGGASGAADLKQLAADLGLDTGAFDACLDSGTHDSVVRAESAMIQSLGVRGTPAFLINEQRIAGAQPFEVFEQIIEAELAAISG